MSLYGPSYAMNTSLFEVSVVLVVAGCSSEDASSGSLSAAAGSAGSHEDGGSGGQAAGTGGTSGSRGTAGGSSEASGDAAAVDAGTVDVGQSDAGAISLEDAGAAGLNELAKAIDGFRMELKCVTYVQMPCEPQNAATPNRGYLCCNVDTNPARTNHPPVDKDLAFGGDPQKLYDVTLRVRGVFENYDYGAAGTKQGDLVRIGGPRPAPYKIHVLGATVADPLQNYFFNAWNDTSNPARVIKADYEVTLRIRGGAKVRFFEYDDIGRIWQNAEHLTVDGIPPYPEAFDGQFIHFNAVSVAAQ